MPKQALPTDSLTAKTATKQLPAGTLSKWAETDVGVWFDSIRELRDKTVYEQFLQQANGYRLSMLTIEPSDDEEIEEEDDLQHRWSAPRFHR